jgi:competence ComEA-like helix-hairpin-helix protein
MGQPMRESIRTLSVALLAVASGLFAQDMKSQKMLFEMTCSACHTTDTATSARRTKDQWKSVIGEMIEQQGAAIPDDAVAPILDYLTATYGKVKVNTAPAGEIRQILGLTPAEADAIVKARQAKGKFENFDEIASVPGVDAKRLEKNRDAIAF